MTVALASAALVVAVGALILSGLVARQSGATASTLARHRHGHALREGTADPGAARSARTGGRSEAPAYGPPTTAQRVVHADEEEPADGADTAEHPAPPLPPRLPRPGDIGRHR